MDAHEYKELTRISNALGQAYDDLKFHDYGRSDEAYLISRKAQGAMAKAGNDIVNLLERFRKEGEQNGNK